MGGIAILIGITVAYVTVDVYGEIANVGGFTVSGLLVLGLTLSLGGLALPTLHQTGQTPESGFE